MEEIQFASIGKQTLQGLFIAGLAAFTLNYIISRLTPLLSKWKSGHEPVFVETEEAVEIYKQAKEGHIGKLQKVLDEKAEDYKERIQIPREEEKLRQRIKKATQFSGPAWKGHGDVLGGESSGEKGAASGEPPNRSAADKRVVQEHINTRVRDAARAELARTLTPKQVIQLSEEPETEGSDVVTIVFKTPIGAPCKRRFSTADTVQNLLDFITTKGFSQRIYTLAMSYPRTILGDSSVCLADLNLGQRVVLNIEDRD